MSVESRIRIGHVDWMGLLAAYKAAVQVVGSSATVNLFDGALGSIHIVMDPGRAQLSVVNHGKSIHGFVVHNPVEQRDIANILSINPGTTHVLWVDLAPYGKYQMFDPSQREKCKPATLIARRDPLRISEDELTRRISTDLRRGIQEFAKNNGFDMVLRSYDQLLFHKALQITDITHQVLATILHNYESATNSIRVVAEQRCSELTPPWESWGWSVHADGVYVGSYRTCRGRRRGRIETVPGNDGSVVFRCHIEKPDRSGFSGVCCAPRTLEQAIQTVERLIVERNI